MKIWAHVLKHMGNDSSSDVIPALHLLLRLQLLCGVCWSCGCVSALEGQQVLVAHLGGLHRDPHSAHWQEGGQGWESGGQMGHLNVGKPTLSSGLGIFDVVSFQSFRLCLLVCSVCRLVPWYLQGANRSTILSVQGLHTLNASGTWQDKV